MKFSKAEFEAVIKASTRTFIPYSQLVLSGDYQARPHTPIRGAKPRMSIPELAASIKGCGLLQNLICVKGTRNLHEVCAGGRRLEALGLLVAAGDLPENYPVPVLVVPADRALAASLAENTFHVPMHPADEFIAFAKLIDQGKSVEDVAALFGVMPLVVKRRMKLAAVSPKLLVQYRQEEIDLQCLMVLASVDDHERQEQAWAATATWNRHPDHLRRLLTQGEIESDRSPVAKYVTVKAYEKAGGPSRRDLFSDNDKKLYLLDPALLDQLAVSKLQRKAKEVMAEGWKWVDVRARFVNDEYAKHGELHKGRREASSEESAELDSLEAQVAQRNERMDEISADEDDDSSLADEYLRLDAECGELKARITALHVALSVWPPELVAQAGCVVYVGSDAAPAVRYGLVRPDDRTEIASLARTARAYAHAHEDAAGEGATALVSLPSPKTRPVHSERLMRNLTAHRVAAIQAELLKRPDVAVATVTAQLATKLLLDGFLRLHSCGDPLTLTVMDTHAALPDEADDIRDCEAWQVVDVQRQKWLALVPREVDAVLPWVLQLDSASLSELFSCLVALSVTGVYGTESTQQRTDGIALAMGVDFSKWWRPTATAYFNHVSKARIAEVVVEAVGVEAAASLQTLKKDAAASRAEQVVAATGWLPSVLRLRDPAPAVPADGTEADERDAKDVDPGDEQAGSGDEDEDTSGAAGMLVKEVSGEHMDDDDAPVPGPEAGLMHTA
ncbi:ParB/RepB/Spo0J family partition protein [Roseateles flavus]|uniref:ParB/RepB/Spo0J family partition protein n=1 Tax=Roseateles flavus TaxID=3149041 RepID=A0ABV0GGB4_9BURK